MTYDTALKVAVSWALAKGIKHYVWRDPVYETGWHVTHWRPSRWTAWQQGYAEAVSKLIDDEVLR